jgi:hypothetical protein
VDERRGGRARPLKRGQNGSDPTYSVRRMSIGCPHAPMEANIMAPMASEGRRRAYWSERVQSEGGRSVAFLHVYIFWPPSRHNFAATACLN